MMEYLLKSMLCLVLLLLFHKLFLQQEVLHRFNRFYLLGAVVFSFLIPLYVVEVASEEPIVLPEPTAFEPQVFQSEYEFPAQTFDSPSVEVQTSESFPWSEVLLGAYLLVSLVFLIRFFQNIRILFNQIHRNATVIFKGYPVVLLEENTLPYSFLKFIFVSKNTYESGEFSEEIFQHELTHVKEGHSWDVLFIELLLIPLWFHPGLYFAKQSIRLNHEFIADQVALKSTSIQAYQRLLLSMTLTNTHNSLVSSLNFSLTKKRLEMMKKKSNPIFKGVKLLVLIPVLGVMVYVFSEKVTAHQELEKVKQNDVLSSDEIHQDFTLKSDGSFVYQNKRYQLSQLPGILEELDKEKSIINIIANSEVKMGVIQDFQRILRESDFRKINYQKPELQVSKSSKDEFYKNVTFILRSKDGEEIEKTYDELSEDLKAGLMDPPRKPNYQVPSNQQFESWKNKDEFAIWIDGKVSENEVLDKRNPSDFVYYTDSFVHNNARSERFPQAHQVSLFTEEGFEKAYGENSGFGKATKGITIFYLGEHEDYPPTEEKEEELSAIQNYKKLHDQYEKNRTEGTHFVNRSEDEQQKLQAQFSELGSLYFRIPLELKRTVSRPTHPFAPYLKLEAEGKVYYKLAEDLTAKEKSLLPPPPPASKNKVEAYHQLFLKYEWIRMEGRKYSNKSQEERAYMYELYNAMQEQYMAMDPIQRRQVKRVNYPFIPLNENGHLTFKVLDELTPEQRAFAGC
ncbi:M56 family metallopeptidase [Algoriphagus halophilus]|uniref:BlaR1 peptidase M56 n=1 Tax=Algoriphagus halophilus TaxID=226505 RepID=A0A1N6D6Y0_9BACT|nr:M56 family metallopeptidase [Algoriphagus halophilus]SIN66483.1 BlaR1 peptidase M56 [Algoriphagus halophilus]